METSKGLIVVCLFQWLYLLKLFEEPEIYRRMEKQADMFDVIHKQYCEFMMLVLSDPMVTSLLNRPRGEKGFRILQGDRLRDILINMIQTEVHTLILTMGKLNCYQLGILIETK